MKQPHVLVIGNGIIGLSIALELGRTGVTCCVIGTVRPGIASVAAAGLLSPSVGSLPGTVRPFFLASLELYPAFVRSLNEYDPSLAMVQGLVEIATEQSSATVSSSAIHDIEPAVVAPHGGTFHRDNGAIDNVRLMDALRKAVAASPAVTLIDDDVASMDLRGESVAVTTRAGRRIKARRAVLAAGAWAARIVGLPRPLPVEPLKGQMLAIGASPLRRAVMSDDVYLVPRDGETVVGATVEHAGFDLTVEDSDIDTLRRAAEVVCPSLRDAPTIRRWAGVRPGTPDLFPIIGTDPDAPKLIYACGHSKNGILLAPATAAVASDLVRDEAPRYPIDGLSIDRFP